ncbi:aldehyde dehydrogenase [Hyphococcus flavus]|uniref:Aldehyde dehydrogenase n=1 Tax=Hyphococcus flavus TaxID=1866326 RepID=A0AAE9ZCL6_9PROT|nr:aldehyde dehydrogenase [Hyphococcus flavus]WDI30108.1 aldehyde dehydrogenase [Hyphococcus flavus]
MPELEKYQLYIGGRFTDPKSGKWLLSENPYTQKDWARIPHANALDIETAVTAADTAFHSPEWCNLTAAARGSLLNTLADCIEEQGEHLAEIETRDNGKLLSEMRAQLSYIPHIFRYFAGLADKVTGDVVPLDRPDGFAYTRKEPLGVIAAITPWNSPLLLASFKLAPALAAGNTIVLKPSEHASASTLEFAKVFAKAGFPDGVLNVVTGYGHEIGNALVAHDKVAKVAFTGGEAGGRAVAQTAGSRAKAVLLELGGKSPNIVFEDADLDNAVNGVIAGIFAASGQTCIAGSRLLVHHSIHDEFVKRLVDQASTARVGDPMALETQVGPVTTKAQQQKILEYIDIAKSEGAECVLGGGAGEGQFVQPTIFTSVKPQMRIAQEEVFGPLLCVLSFENEQEAIEIANGTNYGLAAGIWTQNLARAHRVEKQLKAGTVWINTYRAFSVQLPFGGYKQSGVGRENGRAAVEEFMENKSVWINLAPKFPNPFIMQ